MAYAHTGTVFAGPLAERNARPSLIMRVINALAESRMHAARRAMRARGYLVDENSLIVGELPKVTLADDAELPFAR
jgi:hypothetical protein